MLRFTTAFFAASVTFSAWSPAHAAASGDRAVCNTAISYFERANHLPTKILAAIGIVESGRLDPQTGVAAPWPWAINIEGKGFMFDTAADAILAVKTAQAAGFQSIDVGCMQVNLVYHPHAFANLDDAFDPTSNVRYAASFLMRLHVQIGDWGGAVAAYHSATPEIGGAYAKIVAAVWPLAAQYGLSRDGAAALYPEIDPNHLLTDEFRAQLQAAALFQRQRDASTRVTVKATPIPVTVQTIASTTRGRGKSPDNRSRRSALEAEVDPTGTLTPEFRAQMVAAAEFRHKAEASRPQSYSAKERPLLTEPAAGIAAKRTTRPVRLSAAGN